MSGLGPSGGSFTRQRCARCGTAGREASRWLAGGLGHARCARCCGLITTTLSCSGEPWARPPCAVLFLPPGQYHETMPCCRWGKRLAVWGVRCTATPGPGVPRYPCSGRGGFQAFQRQAPGEFLSPPWCSRSQGGPWKSSGLRVRTWALGQAQPYASCGLPMPQFP